jgi:hypothetical protein
MEEKGLANHSKTDGSAPVLTTQPTAPIPPVASVTIVNTETTTPPQRRRDRGAITPNACTECRKKRAKVCWLRLVFAKRYYQYSSTD